MNASTKKSLSLLVALSSAVACGAFVGCSSSDNTTIVNPDGGPVATDGAPITTGDDAGPIGTTDGAAGDDDGSTGTVDAGPTNLGGGSVSVIQTSATAYEAVAAFAYGTTAATLPSTCTVTDLGNGCSYTACVDAAPVDAGATDAGTVDAGPPAAAPQAGVITLTGAGLASAGITLTPDATTGTYPAYTMGSGSIYTSGGSIAVSAAGDLSNGLSAFTSSVPVAAAPSYTAPTFTTGAVPSTTFDRSSDLTVSWTGGTAGTSLRFSLSESSSTGSKGVACTFDGGAGTGKIPSSGGLANLDQASTTAPGTLFITPTASSSQMVGDNDTSVAGAGDFTVVTSVSNQSYFAQFTNSN